MTSKVTIACLQLQAMDLDRAEDALAHALERIDEAAHSHPDLIVLPECTYPAYYLESLERYRVALLRPHDEVLRLFGERARRSRCHLVAGIATPAGDGLLHNAAVLFDPQGEVAGETSKSFLWHFDQNWFEAGCDYPAFDLPFGRTGIFVCADGRMPEIARTLAVRGARLLVDSTAWVTSGGDRETLTNPQFEYMIPVRAIENGAWIAVANKVGIEAESIVYCGRSCLVAPDGQRVAAASSDRDEILLAEADLSRGGAFPVSRRPECYGVLRQPTASLPATLALREAMVPDDMVVRVGAVQMRPQQNVDGYVRRVGQLAGTLARQGAELILLPGIPAGMEDAPAYHEEYILSPLVALSRELGCGLAFPLIAGGEPPARELVLVDRGAIVGRYRQTHLPDRDAGRYAAGDQLSVLDTRWGRIGCMLDLEGLVPEVPRCLMLQGAELILWAADASTFPLRMIARCRADEDKVFVALATPLVEGVQPATALVAPNGSFLALTLPDIEQGIAGQVARFLTRHKQMAPNTDALLHRRPELYGPLVSEDGRRAWGGQPNP